MKRALVIAATAVLSFPLPASAAEDLVSGLSQDVVEVTSNYTGTDLTVFGAIERPGEAQGRDIVVVVRGPDADMTVRRKDRIAGIWINNARARLAGMPSYYFLAGTRPLNQIASRDTLDRYDLGMADLRPESVLSDGRPEPYRQALMRALRKRGLYAQDATGVEFLSPTLFRARVPIPAAAPRGRYNVQVYLFRDDTVISAQSTPLFVDQTGFERRLFAFAHERPLAYGLATIAMAALSGWLASAFFRRTS